MVFKLEAMVVSIDDDIGKKINSSNIVRNEEVRHRSNSSGGETVGDDCDFHRQSPSSALHISTVTQSAKAMAFTSSATSSESSFMQQQKGADDCTSIDATTFRELPQQKQQEPSSSTSLTGAESVDVLLPTAIATTKAEVLPLADADIRCNNNGTADVSDSGDGERWQQEHPMQCLQQQPDMQIQQQKHSNNVLLDDYAVSRHNQQFQDRAHPQQEMETKRHQPNEIHDERKVDCVVNRVDNEESYGVPKPLVRLSSWEDNSSSSFFVDGSRTSPVKRRNRGYRTSCDSDQQQQHHMSEQEEDGIDDDCVSSSSQRSSRHRCRRSGKALNQQQRQHPCAMINEDVDNVSVHSQYSSRSRGSVKIPRQLPFPTLSMMQQQDDDSYRNAVQSLHALNAENDDDLGRISNMDSTAGPTETLKKVYSSKSVRNWRFFILAVLLTCMIGTAVGVFRHLSNAETFQYHEHFGINADKVCEAIGESIGLTLGSIDSFAVSIMSHTKSTNQTWPYVTIPDFEYRASTVRFLSKAVIINLHPYVEASQRSDWEQFTTDNNGWVKESIEVQKSENGFYGPIITNYTTLDVIYGCDEFDKDEGEIGRTGTNRTYPSYYFPSWEGSPVVPLYPPYNWDLLSKSNISSTIAVVNTNNVSISEVYNIPNGLNDPIQLKEVEANANWFAPYLHPSRDPREPVSDIYYPLLNHEMTTSSSIMPVGVLSVSFYWREIITGVLPDDHFGIVVVFENPCNPPFTYEILGPEPIYLGVGDLHDKRFDSMGRSSFLLDLYFSAPHGSSYNGLPINPDVCPFTIRIYPHIDLYRSFKTNSPMVYSFAAVFIFAFTSVVFLVYNHWVEQRQRQLMMCAIKSSINAKELDKIVRNRTITLQETNEQLERANRKIQETSASQLEHFACMSHEIRTPLNGINGLSSIVLADMEKLIVNMEGGKSNEKDGFDKRESFDIEALRSFVSSSFESMQMIVSSGELLRTIVDDVLDFAKLGSGKVDIDIQKNVSLQGILDTVIASVESVGLVASKNLTIQTVFGTNVYPYITTDCRRLQQILYNLLGNAVKFSRDGGIIELKVYQLDDIPGGHSRLRFFVKDFGKGIARSKFQAIFEPFIQADGAHTEIKHGGTGLGLAITSRLVDALGGSIAVDSEVGKWTEFRVDFPCEEMQERHRNYGSDDAVVHTNSQSILKTCKIYLIDDNIVNRRQIESVFECNHISCIPFDKLSELQTNTIFNLNGDANNAGTTHVILVREDLMDQQVFDRLSWDSMNRKLITFGSKRDIRDASNGRLRSLVRILPMLLLKNLADCVRKPSSEINSTRKSPASNAQLNDNFPDLKILVAEDNIVNQKVLARILNRLRIAHVTIVDNGQSAIEAESSEVFDIILMDMHMPILDGLSACKEIVARQTADNSSRPKAKIVFLTAHVSEAMTKECYGAGAVGFLSKPCSLERIADCLRQLLSNVENAPSS